MTDREKFETICDLTTQIVGLQKGSLAYKTRKQEVLVPRMVASNIAILTKDIHVTIIADIIKKDRTSVMHYRDTHKQNYASFPFYRNTFNKVYNAFNELEKVKLVFSEKEEMIRHLLDAGVKIIAKPQVRIKVTSGKYKYLVPTNYLDFSKNIDIIKDSLRKYDYSIDIITI
tara:strand:+ start:681 stop:1196 length:516 start_codon:yes stop_codon:yes gene_type:complete